MQSKQDMEKLGLTMKEWGKYTYEYLYTEPEISVDLVEGFIDQVLAGEK